MKEYKDVLNEMKDDIKVPKDVWEKYNDALKAVAKQEMQTNSWPVYKRWMPVAATFALMIATTVGVLAATGFFNKETVIGGNTTTYKFDIDYELTPGVFEVEPGYLPEGYEDNGEGFGKYSAGDKKWISAVVNDTTGLAWQGNELEIPAQFVEKTTIANMEADILIIERADIKQNFICLFNPIEGYVAEVYGGEGTSLEDLKKFAEKMKVVRVADGEKMTADEQADIDKLISEDKKRMSEMLAKIETDQKRGLTDEELLDIGEESFTGTLYGDGSRTKDVGYTITSVEYIDNIEGYDENNFRDYETIRPWLNEDGSLKPYLRTEYEVATDGDIVEEKMVEQKLMKVMMKVKRYQESFDSGGNGEATEFDGGLIPLQKRTDGTYTWNDKTAYSPAEGQEYQMSQVIYFDKTENHKADDYSFFLRNLEVGEEVECTLIYIVDEDLKETIAIKAPGITTEDEMRILHKTW